MHLIRLMQFTLPASVFRAKPPDLTPQRQLLHAACSMRPFLNDADDLLGLRVLSSVGRPFRYELVVFIIITVLEISK